MKAHFRQQFEGDYMFDIVMYYLLVGDVEE